MTLRSLGGLRRRTTPPPEVAERPTYQNRLNRSLLERLRDAVAWRLANFPSGRQTNVRLGTQTHQKLAEELFLAHSDEVPPDVYVLTDDAVAEDHVMLYTGGTLVLPPSEHVVSPPAPPKVKW